LIPTNSTYTGALNILKSNGIIHYKEFYLLLAKLTRTDRKLKAGYYEFYNHSSPFEVLYALNKGETITDTLTVVEGDTIVDICARLSQQEEEDIVYEYCLQLAGNKNFLRSLNINAPSLEGYLFPETYLFSKGVPLQYIFARMVKELQKHFDKHLLERARALGMTRREVLTLASMIAKEAGVDEEKPLISAVFHNRLQTGMMLQSDPTAAYGIKQRGEKITNQDVRRYSAYNTYVIQGLPPGPISSAGIKSIKAALYPAKVDYLYFVAKKDGTHHFSTNYLDHLYGIQKYLPNMEICIEKK
jgi:UPF0755 protein